MSAPRKDSFPYWSKKSGQSGQYATNSDRLRDTKIDVEPRSSSSASEIIHQLRAFGPDHVPAWAQLSNADRFCDRCAQVSWDPVHMYLAVADGYSWFPKVPLYNVGRTVEEVREAAHRGCHLCTMILTCLLTMRYRLSIGVDPVPWGLSSINDKSIVRVDVEVMAHDPPAYLTVGIAEDIKPMNPPNHSEAVLDQWIDLSIPISSAVREPTSSVTVADSPESIANYWLQKCLTSHDRCVNQIPILPTRVIDVNSRGEPFLVIPAGKRARYATLSYCVGQYELLKTTKENIEAFKLCIPTVELPQTVKDAVEMTRVLGLQFLWIDSLCIDQSSLSDWEVELSSMAEIYRNATITVAATSSTNAGSGCTPTQNKLQLAPCRPVSGIVILPDYGRYKWIFQKGVLETRAWTYQEVQLSERVLRCGGEELVWQCRTCKQREGDPAAAIRHDAGTFGGYFGTRTLDDFPLKTKRSEMFFRWYQVVQEFLTRNLSFPEDKLPAFSGMASHFAALLGSAIGQSEAAVLDGVRGQEPRIKRPSLTYVCGLWKEDLLHGLAWRSIYSTSQVVSYRAPSWSWAGFEGGKIVYDMYALRSDTFHAETLDVAVTVPGLNPFGRVRCGKLTLLGPLAPVPSQIFGDDSDMGSWEWKWPLLTFEQVGEPPLQSFCLRLQTACCLILTAVDRAWRSGVYRRVGMLVLPTELEDPKQKKLQTLDNLDWTQQLVTII